MTSNEDEIDKKKNNEIRNTVVIPYDKAGQKTPKSDTRSLENQSQSSEPPKKERKLLNRNILIAIGIISAIIVGLVIFLSIHFTKKTQKKDNEPPTNEQNKEQSEQLGGKNDENTENHLNFHIDYFFV